MQNAELIDCEGQEQAHCERVEVVFHRLFGHGKGVVDTFVHEGFDARVRREVSLGCALQAALPGRGAALLGEHAASGLEVSHRAFRLFLLKPTQFFLAQSGLPLLIVGPIPMAGTADGTLAARPILLILVIDHP